MPPVTYPGLCIGGPLAGQSLTHDAHQYHVQVQDEVVIGASGAQGQLPEIRFYTYEWQIWQHFQGSMCVWAHRDLNVLQVLLDTYAAVHRDRALLEPADADD